MPYFLLRYSWISLTCEHHHVFFLCPSEFVFIRVHQIHSAKMKETWSTFAKGAVIKYVKQITSVLLVGCTVVFIRISDKTLITLRMCSMIVSQRFLSHQLRAELPSTTLTFWIADGVDDRCKQWRNNALNVPPPFPSSHFPWPCWQIYRMVSPRADLEAREKRSWILFNLMIETPKMAHLSKQVSCIRCLSFCYANASILAMGILSNSLVSVYFLCSQKAMINSFKW